MDARNLIIGIWYAFGKHDLVTILDYPDNVEVAAAMVTVATGGALKGTKTTPLMTIEEDVGAMKKAGEVSGVYKPLIS
jgi:uncharacterized protein with GYD domain